ncbi:hypothetical protein K458DRAFT_436973 [Lentithecium fluviatile CBS 122367]|uniref:CFEM domain-containing protein n=1 Tax=Lentithecium fluviatile CBS 122367 TaxID=1168545 RepID=A0A6G1IFD3_9PLEO|nr:hypothetical protein K458DRAFT_436973 [Lentithecium fluviatile CBS 122367]
MARTAVLTIYILALGLSATAQLANLPTCSQTCINEQSSSSSCSAVDTACLCSDQAFVSALASCLQATCSADDYTASVDYLTSLCASSGVTISLPGSASSSVSSSETSTSTSATSTSTSTTSTSTTPTSTSASTSATSTSTETPTSVSAKESTTLTGLQSTTASAPSSDLSSGSTSSAAAPNSSGSSPGLSPGAAAGIGVGATLAIIGLAVGGFVFYRRRRRSKADTPIANTDTGMAGGTDKEATVVSANEPWKEIGVYYEADGVIRGELEDRHGVGVAQQRLGMAEMRG